MCKKVKGAACKRPTTPREIRHPAGYSTAKVTVTLPNATTYTATMSSSGTYSKILTIKFRADTASGARV